MSQANESSFASPEDEDLFDFPVAPLNTPGGGLGDVFGDPIDDLEPDVSLGDILAEQEESTEDTNQPSAQDGPANNAQEQEEVTPKAVAASPDFDLDEDLFAFDELFEDSLPLASEADLAELTEQYERELAGANHPKGGSVGTPLPVNNKTKQKSSAKPKENKPTAAPVVAQAALTKPNQKTTGTGSLDGAIPDHLWAPPPALVGAEPKRSRLLEVLAISFLVLNTGLILMAWRAGDNFQETLASVTRTVTDAVADGHAKGQMSQPVVISAPSVGSAPIEPDIDSTVVEESSLQTKDQNMSPSQLLDMPRAALDLAQERIRKGLYSDARRGLANLLANRDRTALSDEMVIEAEALIAESYAIQAMEVKQ